MAEFTGKENLDFLERFETYVKDMDSMLSRFIGDEAAALDFGAGIGTYAKRLAAHGKKIGTVEIDPDYLAALKQMGFDSWASLDEVASTYPRIYSVSVMEHIENDRGIFTSMYSRASSGGKVFIYVPAFQLLYSKMDKKVGHIRRYSRSDLTGKIKEAGFSILSVEYIDSIGFFAGLLYRFIGDKEGAIDSPSIMAYYKYIYPISRFFDRLGMRKLVGKNLLVVAQKD